MITRLTGIVESIDERSASVRPVPGVDITIDILLPSYLAVSMKAARQAGLERSGGPRTEQPATFYTLCYLEGQGQGTSFIPRLIGFESARDRAFFEVFTTVKGIGNRKALRALARPPAEIAAAIARRDARALTELPEIGKRLAETVVAELHGKVESFALQLDDGTTPRSPIMVEPKSSLAPAMEDAVNVLCTLGETRLEAERKVQLAVQRAGAGAELGPADKIVAMVFAGR